MSPAKSPAPASSRRTAPAMAIVKTQALALRITPYSNTSQIVTWLTEEGEVMSTLIKGACRPKSPFLGQYDLCCTSELLYYRRAGDGLHLARECALRDARLALRVNWRAYGCASWICQLLQVSCMAGERYAGAFPLAVTALDALAARRPRLEALFWFELLWLGHLGFSPQLHACTQCRGLLNTPEPPLRWGVEGVICKACASGPPGGNRGPRGASLPLRPDLLAILRRWQAQPTPHTLAAIQCSRQQLLEFDRILAMVLTYHVECPPESRMIAMALLRASIGKNGSPA